MRHNIEQCSGGEAKSNPRSRKFPDSPAVLRRRIATFLASDSSLDVRERQQPGGQIAQNSSEAESRNIDKKETLEARLPVRRAG